MMEHQNDIPELNLYQCGTAVMHSLEQAKETASSIIEQGIGINYNKDILLTDDQLNQLAH